MIKYEKPEDVPTEELSSRLEVLSDAVANRNMSEFYMRIPAEVHHDADLVLAEAAQRLKRLEKAEKSLKQSGFEDRGGELWAPPIRDHSYVAKFFDLEKKFELLEDFVRKVARTNGRITEEAQDLLGAVSSITPPVENKSTTEDTKSTEVEP